MRLPSYLSTKVWHVGLRPMVSRPVWLLVRPGPWNPTATCGYIQFLIDGRYANTILVIVMLYFNGLSSSNRLLSAWISPDHPISIGSHRTGTFESGAIATTQNFMDNFISPNTSNIMKWLYVRAACRTPISSTVCGWLCSFLTIGWLSRANHKPRATSLSTP